ncbi:MAG TPA: response regulator [Syntrophorhabdales bacterium]|nr:response regulator [Syntrophorhabdales bacterium]
MIKKKSLVYVVDDDDSVRRAFQFLFQSVDFDVQTFCSAEEFLKSPRLRDGSCIILDMRMPGMTGLDLQRELVARKVGTPVIVVSAYDDASTRQLSRELGAVAFFRKPVDDQALLDAIWFAIQGR